MNRLLSVRASVADRLSRPSHRALAAISALLVVRLLPTAAVLALSLAVVAHAVAADRRDERQDEHGPQEGETR